MYFYNIILFLFQYPTFFSFRKFFVHPADFPYLTPYNYAASSPIGKLDVGGLWSIEVHLLEDRKKEGLLVLKNDDGNIVGIWRTKGRAVSSSNVSALKRRIMVDGDTPTGTWDIKDLKGRSNTGFYSEVNDKDKKSYGKHRIWLTNYRGELGLMHDTKRHVNTIRVHGALRPSKHGRIAGENGETANGSLWNTNGCLRVAEREMLRLYDLAISLKQNPTIFTVDNDLYDPFEAIQIIDGIDNEINRVESEINRIQSEIFSTYMDEHSYSGIIGPIDPLEEIKFKMRKKTERARLERQSKLYKSDLKFYKKMRKNYNKALDNFIKN